MRYLSQPGATVTKNSTCDPGQHRMESGIIINERIYNMFVYTYGNLLIDDLRIEDKFQNWMTCGLKTTDLMLAQQRTFECQHQPVSKRIILWEKTCNKSFKCVLGNLFIEVKAVYNTPHGFDYGLS